MRVACVLCAAWVDRDTAHDFHEDDCPRFLAGQCQCERQVCSACCPDDGCVTPLAKRLRAAHDEHVAQVPDDPEQAA